MPNLKQPLLTSLLLAFSSAIVLAQPDESIQFFEKSVRPVLAANCYECHGVKKQHASLRLDSRASIIKGSDHGAVVIEGKPNDSKLIHAISHQGDLRMPDKGEKLPEAAISAIAHWIEIGLPWPEEAPPAAAMESIESRAKSHWAFQPLQKSPEKSVDQIVHGHLQSKGISPAPLADAATLIRRAHFSLIGFPPTAAEINAFVSASALDVEGAWAALIDRLLASPHYGERWARHWLDVARYADSKGYVFQEERRYAFAYTYRDWVVRAMNDDLPYDKFLTYQLAADKALGDGDDKNHLAAMGFLTVGRRFLNRQSDIIDDRIDVVSRGTMGLTVSCARCHDHKFDAIPTADYYSLYGVFDSSTEPSDMDKPIIGSNEDKAAFAEFEKEKANIENEIAAYINGKLELVRTPDHIARFLKLCADNWNPEKDAIINSANASDIYPRLAEHWHRFLKEAEKRNDPVFQIWHALRDLPEAGETPFEKRVVEKIAQLSDANPEILNAFREQPPKSREELHSLYAQHLAGGLREVSATPDSPLAINADTLTSYFFTKHSNELRDIRNKHAALIATAPGAPPRAMVMVDHESPREPVIFERGNPDRRGAAVPRQFLRLLAGENRKPFTNGSGRLELAQAIVSPDNPLTPRVMANRVWLHHFGQSLVETPSDLGLQCPAPVQLELLDHLAANFRDKNWSLKNLHREIMLSATYRQSSALRPECRESDPENNLYHRMPRRRLDFEALRDSLLKVSGEMDESIGGRPVSITDMPFAKKRTLYGFVDRQNLPGVFRTFDFASPDTHSPKRHFTTVPQQALYMMNGEFIYEQASALTRGDEFQKLTDANQRIYSLYERVLSRSPSAEELQIGLEFIQAGSPQTPSAWLFGYGWFDEAEKKTHFTELPHFSNNAWAGGEQLPDPKLGWVSIRATSGHPGADRHSSIVRWIATRSSIVETHGEIVRPSDQGDGVRARIVSSRQGLLGTWDVDPAKSVPTYVGAFEVREGDVIDFIVDCRGDVNHDSYSWAPWIKPVDEGAPLAELGKDFSGPIRADVWTRYAHVLLSSNEFLFVD